MKQKRSNLNSEMYLFEEAFSAVVVIVATRSERSNCSPRRCHDASRRGNTHAQHELQAASSQFFSVRKLVNIRKWRQPLNGVNCGVVLGKKERRERTEVSRGGIQEHQDKGGSQAL